MEIKRIKQKKGASHVEIILSFVIFLGFLIFLLAIFNPFKISEDSRVYVELAERAITNFSQAELELFSISLNSNPKGCFSSPASLSNKIIVKDENNTRVSASYGNGLVNINSGGKFFYVYSSSEFKNENFDDIDSCKQLNPGEYTLGLSREYKMLSYGKLLELNNSYQADYRKLKNSLGIPATEEFLFSIRDNLGNNIIKIDKTPGRVRVSARDFPIQIVYDDGSLKHAVLNIMVW